MNKGKKSKKRKPTTSAGKRPLRKPAVARRPTHVSSKKKRKREYHPAPGSAVAAGAMPTFSEESAARMDMLQDNFNAQQESMLLTNIHSEMAEIESTLALLPTHLQEVRRRGYIFQNFMENKVKVLTEKWAEMRERISTEITRRTRELERDSDAAESALRQAVSGSSAQMSRAESAVSTFESKVRAAQSAVKAMYAPLRQNVNQTQEQIARISWMLDQVDEASFQLHPAESVVAVCKAQYIEREDEGPEGRLYLTDERLLFEQKEQIATKKVLFITTEKKTVQEFIFGVPVGQIEEVQASDKRKLFRRKEMLALAFAPEADLSGATLRLLDAQNEDWDRLIGRVKSGEIDKERTQPKDEAAEEAVRTAPTKCPTCGATLDVEIVRGMKEITCEYCGTVIRL